MGKELPDRHQRQNVNYRNHQNIDKRHDNIIIFHAGKIHVDKVDRYGRKSGNVNYTDKKPDNVLLFVGIVCAYIA